MDEKLTALSLPWLSVYAHLDLIHFDSLLPIQNSF